MTTNLRRTLVWSLLVPLIGFSSLGSTGCASIIRGKHQEIRLDLRPADAVATYKGRKIEPLRGQSLLPVLGGKAEVVHEDDTAVS